MLISTPLFYTVYRPIGTLWDRPNRFTYFVRNLFAWQRSNVAHLFFIVSFQLKWLEVHLYRSNVIYWASLNSLIALNCDIVHYNEVHNVFLWYVIHWEFLSIQVETHTQTHTQKTQYLTPMHLLVVNACSNSHSETVLWTNKKVMIRMNGFYYGVKERMDEWRNDNNNNIWFECEQYNLLSQFNLHVLSMFVYYCSLIALLAYAHFCRSIKTHRSQFWGG